MFSGQGSQYVDMGLEALPDRAGVPLRARQLLRAPAAGSWIRPSATFSIRSPRTEISRRRACSETAITQPALFALEYSLAKLWIEFGIEPKAMIGHSIGEYVAACLAGVFSLEDALSLVATRGRLMDQMPAGAMLAAPLLGKEAQPFLTNGVCLAAVNGPGLCVFSGPAAAIEGLSAQLASRGQHGRRLHTSHAFHSSMMDPIVWPFVQKVQSLTLKSPEIPYLSNLTGTWMTPEAARIRATGDGTCDRRCGSATASPRS